MKYLLIIFGPIIFLGCEQKSASAGNTSALAAGSIASSAPVDKDIISGKLKNIVVGSPLPLIGGLSGSSCEKSENGYVVHLFAITTNVECTVTFPSSFETEGGTVCDLVNKRRLDGAVCRANEGAFSPASLDLIYDGSNFSFTKSPEIVIPATCSDLSGKWAAGSWDWPVTPENPIFSITQEGCRKTTIVGMSRFRGFVAGEFVNDGTPTGYYGFWSFFDKDGNWRLMEAGGKWGTGFRKGVTPYGRPFISSDYTTLEHSIRLSSPEYLKVEDFKQYGPCWSLTPKDLTPGAICTTSKGFQWLRVADGWKDLTSSGLTWLDFDPWEWGEYKSAVKTCESKNAFLPSSYVRGTNIYEIGYAKYSRIKPDDGKNYPIVISFPDVDSDFAVASQHGLHEVFAINNLAGFKNKYFWTSTVFTGPDEKYATLYKFDIYSAEGHDDLEHFIQQGTDLDIHVRCVRN